jgi:hypothetical protein
MARRLDDLYRLGDQTAEVEIDEIFTGPNPMRPHRYACMPEIEAWLDDVALPGSYVHRERKIRHNTVDNVYFTNEEEIFHVYSQMDVVFPIVGYRHRFSFSDANTAFAFKMMFGSLSVQLGS